MSDGPTTTCHACKEPVSIDATVCPHCGARQATARSTIAVTAVAGILLLPVTYVFIPAALSYGVPTGLAEGIAAGLAWGIALLGPLALLVALGGYQQRREARRE